MDKLATKGAVSTRAQIESELTRVQRALALAEEACQRAKSEHGATREALAQEGEACKKAEEESGRLINERLSLVMELGAVKDEFAAFREKAAADRETMEAEFDSNGDALFNYGNGCCVFTHNICEKQASYPGWNVESFSPAHPRILRQPSMPPSISSAAPALDPAEEHPETSPTVAGEETILPMDPSAEQDTLAE